MEAHNFVERGESALVVFTREGAFEMDDDGKGFISNLPINIHEEIDRVILFVAGAAGAHDADGADRWEDEEDDEQGENQIWVADYAGVDGAEGAGFIVLFERAVYAGATDAEWSSFAGTGDTPIRYIQPPPSSSYGP